MLSCVTRVVNSSIFNTAIVSLMSLLTSCQEVTKVHYRPSLSPIWRLSRDETANDGRICQKVAIHAINDILTFKTIRLLDLVIKTCVSKNVNTILRATLPSSHHRRPRWRHLQTTLWGLSWKLSENSAGYDMCERPDAWPEAQSLPRSFPRGPKLWYLRPTSHRLGIP